jgi:hypothetical protein
VLCSYNSVLHCAAIKYVPEGTNGEVNENTTVDKTDAELFNIRLGIEEGSIRKEGRKKERKKECKNVHGLLT